MSQTLKIEHVAETLHNQSSSTSTSSSLVSIARALARLIGPPGEASRRHGMHHHHHHHLERQSRRLRPRAVHTLAVAALALSAATVQSSRSCTNQGQVHVPCDDHLVLEPTEKFLLTLGGHGCYDIVLRSSALLDVFFYEAHGSLYAWRLREMQAIDPDIELLGDSFDATTAADPPSSLQIANATATARLNTSAASAHLCDSSRVCHRVMRGLSRRGVYNLVVAYSREQVDAAALATSTGIALSLESCDQVSLSHMIGLFVVGCMGFASVMLCLCLLGEFVLGLRSVTKFRRSIQRRHQFVELTQIEPTKDLHCESDATGKRAGAQLPSIASPPATDSV